MLWGCISFYACGCLEAIDGHINEEKYLNLLRSVVKPEMDASRDQGRVLIFQQDNATSHKTSAVMAYLASWGYETLDWPPQSPDLSPIETVWNAMKMKMKARRPRPRTKATMRNAMMDIWDNLEDSTRMGLITGFKDRLICCIANNGGLVDLNKV
jgi:transposase